MWTVSFQFAKISELEHFKSSVLIFVRLCGYLKPQDGACTVFTYDSHYFQQQSSSNCETICHFLYDFCDGNARAELRE